MKIAILHEMLIKLGWAEKVVESMLKIFPEADLFTLIYDEKKVWNIFPKQKINPQVFSLPTQKRYNLLKKQRFCLPLMAQSVEALDFWEYDVVLCSSSWFAHWAITKPETKFIVYYHSPARYMWDWTNEYKRDLKIPFFKKFFIYKLNKLFLKLRIWDVIASSRVDIVLANSKNTASRIKKYYRREAQVIFPPIETDRFWKKVELKNFDFLKKNNLKENDYYIIISALTEFKKIDIAIDAFNKMPDKNLVIIWKWEYREELEKKVKQKNIFFASARYGDELVYLVQNSLWLIFPWEEDFWMVPVEAMAAWKPVFALNKWWLTETVLAWITWEFFEEKNGSDFIKNFLEFDKKNKSWFYKEENCKKRALDFSYKIFEEKIKKLV